MRKIPQDRFKEMFERWKKCVSIEKLSGDFLEVSEIVAKKFVDSFEVPDNVDINVMESPVWTYDFDAEIYPIVCKTQRFLIGSQMDLDSVVEVVSRNVLESIKSKMYDHPDDKIVFSIYTLPSRYYDSLDGVFRSWMLRCSIDNFAKRKI